MDSSTRPRTRWRSAVWIAATILVGLGSSLALWDPLDADDRAHILRITDQTLASVCSDLDADVRSRVLAQVRLGELWAWEEPGQSLTGPEWTLNSRLFLEHYPSELQLEWVDTEYRRQWEVRRDGVPDLQLPPETTTAVLRTALDQPLREGRSPAAISTSLRLPNGRWVIRIAVGVVRENGLIGFLVAVSDVRSGFETMLQDHRDLGYWFSILDAGGHEIYRSLGAPTEDDRRWAREAPLPLPGTTWRVRVWPSARLLGEMRSSLPELAGVLGALLGCALLAAIRFGLDARGSSRLLRDAHAKLDERVKQRTLELQRINEDLEAQVERRTRAEDSLQQLSGHLLRLQDEERRRIARELHDGTTQLLGAVAISLERAEQLVPRSADIRLAGLLQDSAKYLDEATREIRTVSYLLHPPILDELGLEGAVRWYAQGFGERSGIHVDVETGAPLGRLGTDVELTFFRIVQEALSNVHHHSGSATATIALARDASSAMLEISDRGTGIPSALLEGEALGFAAGLGVGLAGMRERVRQLHGVLSISSTSPGTTIRVVLPLSGEQAAE